MSGPEDMGWTGFLDPEHALERTEEHRAMAEALVERSAAEVYSRRAERTRVRFAPEEGEATTDHVVDGGIAVRIREAGPNGYRFGACSGDGPESLRTALDLARAASPRVPFRSDGEGGGWSAVRRIDHPDSEERDVSVDQLREWVQDRMGRLEAVHLETRPIWVEMAWTLETLAGISGTMTSRCRVRFWASESERDPRTGTNLVRVAAARSLNDLALGAEQHNQLDRVSLSRLAIATSVPAVEFTPEASTQIILALSRHLHGPRAPLGATVGPAWRLREDPAAPRAMGGGIFDDVGEETAVVELADGRVVRAGLRENSSQWRSSFRDPPTPAWSHLVLDAQTTTAPPDAWVVDDVHVVPEPGRPWTCLVRGCLRRQGELVARFEDARICEAPESIAAAAVATVGVPIGGALGVTCPGIVFEGIRLRG